MNKENKILYIKEFYIKFLNLNLSKVFENNSFEIISSKIMINKYLLNTIFNFINSLKILIDYDKDIDIDIINPKIFLSSYLIKYFKEDVLSSDLQSKELILFEKSDELIEFINNINNNITLELFEDLVKKLNTFKIIFNDWKRQDLKSQLDIYCEIYYNYSTNIEKLEEEDKNNEYKVYLENIKSIVNQAIKNLIGENKSQNIINDYKFIPKIYDNTLDKIIKENLKKIYLDILSNDLKKEIADFTQIEFILIDINKYLDVIYNNTKNKVKWVYSNIDDIKENIKCNKFNNDDIINICKHLLNELLILDSKEYDNSISEMLKNLDNINNINEFIKIIIEIFDYSLTRLESLSKIVLKIKDLK